MKIELRPPRREDAPAIAAGLNEFNRAAGLDSETPEEVAARLDTPSLDIQRNARIALVRGEIVGYGAAADFSGEGKFVMVDARADPAFPEAGAALLDFADARARELALPDGKIKASAPARSTDAQSLLESRGYAVDHYSFRLIVDLNGEPRLPEWPGGVSVRTFRLGEDDRAVYELNQETFADLRGYSRIRFEDWRHWLFREPFDPELWFLAIADGALQGIALCRLEHAGQPELGWVSVLGVRRPWRRKGLGLALLLHSFRALRARGNRRVGLGVDADNPTGALRLYQRAGMREERRYVEYEKAVE